MKIRLQAETVDGNQKSGVISPVEGTVVEIPFIYKVLAPSKRWLTLGFLNHQQNDHSSHVFFLKENDPIELIGWTRSLPGERLWWIPADIQMIRIESTSATQDASGKWRFVGITDPKNAISSWWWLACWVFSVDDYALSRYLDKKGSFQGSESLSSSPHRKAQPSVSSNKKTLKDLPSKQKGLRKVSSAINLDWTKYILRGSPSTQPPFWSKWSLPNLKKKVLNTKWHQSSLIEIWMPNLA